MNTLIRNRLFNINSDKEFEEIAIEIYHYQNKFNPVYSKYSSLIA